MTEQQRAKLLPCPFCGLPLTRGSRPINPNARCTTEDCYGAKMPVVNLDVPASVAAWNTRKPADDMLAALKLMLAHSCVADADPTDKDAEDHAAERAARAAIRKAGESG